MGIQARLTPARAVASNRPPGNPPVLVACSGGPDSVALAHLLVDAGVDVVALAHVDHGLREGSAQDGRVVADHAAALVVPWLSRRVEVDGRGSLEQAARARRWSVLREMAAERGAKLIATGHTADDQAETVLMRMARGAGTTGIAAMRVLADGVWRPLLPVRRHQVRALCAARGWEVVADPSNQDRRHERNRVRLDVLPLLGERAVPALARAAALAADDDDLLEELAASAPVELQPGGTARLPLAWLETAHPALARRALRAAARWAGAALPLPAARIEDARAGLEVSLGGGLSTWRDGGDLVLGRRYGPPP